MPPAFLPVRDVLLLTGVSGALGLAHLAARPELPLSAPAPTAAAPACSVGEPFALVERIDLERARARLGDPGVTFVDARPVDAFRAAHIPGAINLPAGEAAGILEVQSIPIPSDDLVVTYCDTRACEQAEYLGLLLRDAVGCREVRVLAGGWRAWIEAGAPVGPDPAGAPAGD